jgi:glycosyl transferase family 25
LFSKEKSFTLPLKTYVINLDRTPERYKKIDESLNKYKIPHQRFSAVDGYKLKIKNINTCEVFTGEDLQNNPAKIDPSSYYSIYCPSAVLRYIPKPLSARESIEYMTAGELGCYCSHVELWKKIKDQKIPYSLILEDDADLQYDFAEKLENVILNLPKDWDIVYLFFSGNKKMTKYNEHISKLGTDGYMFGTVAMLVSHEGAKKMLDYNRAFSLTIDRELSNAVNEEAINAYAETSLLMGSVVDHNAKNSIINKMGRRING